MNQRHRAINTRQYITIAVWMMADELWRRMSSHFGRASHDIVETVTSGPAKCTDTSSDAEFWPSTRQIPLSSERRTRGSGLCRLWWYRKSFNDHFVLCEADGETKIDDLERQGPLARLNDVPGLHFDRRDASIHVLRQKKLPGDALAVWAEIDKVWET